MSASVATVLAALADFDGKRVEGLQAVVAEGPATPEVVEVLIDAFDGEPDTATAASWLVRAYLEQGLDLDPRATTRLISRVAALPDGFARLHVCQAVRHLDVPTAAAPRLAHFLRACADSRNTYLRAWAPDAFARLALQHAAFGDEARRRVAAALNDDAASVRARARNTLRET